MADRLSIISGVATRYAGALFDLAQESSALDSVDSDLKRFSRLVEDSADLRRLIRSPAFSADEQLRAISAVMEAAGIGGLVGSFVKVTTKNRRLFILPDVIRAYAQLLARHRGEVSAEVTSAEPLSEKHVSELKGALKASLGKDEH